MRKPKTSDAIKLLDLVWKNTNDGTSHSYERLNHAMHAALSLAIGACFKFQIDDYRHILCNYRTGYWIGESDEWVYKLAIGVENMSAIQSFEAEKDREPFIADDVSFEVYGGWTHGERFTRQRERLCVGARFPWKGMKLTVTSFANDQSYLTACSYKKDDGTCGRAKIDKRIKITRQDILDNRAMRKEQAAR